MCSAIVFTHPAGDRELIRIRPLESGDTAELLEVRLCNREHLEPWESVRGDTFWTLAGQQEHVRKAVSAREAGRAFPFTIEHQGRIVGTVNLNDVVRRAFQSAHLGYWVDADVGGVGFATEAVRQAIEFAFTEGDLHRVQAAVIPRNGPSIRVLEKCGFRKEGLARRYLNIAGVWEDHRIFAITIEDWALR